VALSACGVGKELAPDLDYGPEDAAVTAKDDSATNPASMARLALGTPLRTTFTATKRWRAFKFAATAGQKVDVLVDGLRGLDTVAYIYNVSATTGRPYSRSIARNDDTEASGWTVGSSTTFNPQSSSIFGFVPRYTRDYAVVVTTYQQAGRGTANVVVRAAPVELPKFVAAGTGRFVDLVGAGGAFRVRGEVMKVAPEVNALVPSHTALQDMGAFTDAYRVDPATLRAHVAATPAGPAIVGAAFAEAFVGGDDDPESRDYIAGSAVDAISLQRVGAAYADLLARHRDLSAAEWAPVRAAFDRLGAAAANGGTHAYTIRMEESGDWSYLAVVVLDVGKGEIRLLNLRRHD
jgi:hypothetical protein